MKELDYSYFKGVTFIFIGENATTGTPNKLTGRMSKFGRIYQTRNKSDAIEFASNYQSSSMGKVCIVGNIKEMRKLCLGDSLKNFFTDCAYCTKLEDF